MLFIHITGYDAAGFSEMIFPALSTEITTSSYPRERVNQHYSANLPPAHHSTILVPKPHNPYPSPSYTTSPRPKVKNPAYHTQFSTKPIAPPPVQNPVFTFTLLT
ncbi:hypothetical protein KHC33_15275 [Methanospirillum sp. J.3.6.1-F.2.7.3]|uniref:Uncharacterized protein n=1 Tax=Methanospirillum purgamenti TaxID=2834276 RepID=A0A8E7B068_9EURY|nr:hypothetical protein [Methanospirillum sp. J.3.6.1-F.2.7.3]QVV88661.1 hypothetical protein KHC33_15275 [Methanospirillum sp. J.3.6.1-F.2.7.3]